MQINVKVHYCISQIYETSPKKDMASKKKHHQWWKGPQQKLDLDTLKIHGVNT